MYEQARAMYRARLPRSRCPVPAHTSHRGECILT